MITREKVSPMKLHLRGLIYHPSPGPCLSVSLNDSSRGANIHGDGHFRWDYRSCYLKLSGCWLDHLDRRPELAPWFRELLLKRIRFWFASYAKYPRLGNSLDVDLGKILHQTKFMKFISVDTERLDVNNSVSRLGGSDSIRDGGRRLRYEPGELLLCWFLIAVIQYFSLEKVNLPPKGSRSNFPCFPWYCRVGIIFTSLFIGA